MLRHAQRLSLILGIATAALIACTPANAEGPATPAPAQKKGTQAKKPPAPPPAAAGDEATKPATGQDAAQPAPEASAPSETGGKCTGKATFCAVYSSIFCSSQPGCAYSYASRMCMGIAVECDKATNATFCGKIKGCTWK
ncbi:hypothetical protein [Myxococcus landrumensis]|uniref:Lipoprotein n=1 Tax=Myxococcus landrumensis TaxID=2813577 RepID=A0ABX7NBG0_9BACT|nr:hypothetical protein [Myxococcus landrumus]QSQ16127.1 hypothetical protein JY572_08795 [Myxococcus landrumus]